MQLYMYLISLYMYIYILGLPSIINLCFVSICLVFSDNYTTKWVRILPVLSFGPGPFQLVVELDGLICQDRTGLDHHQVPGTLPLVGEIRIKTRRTSLEVRLCHVQAEFYQRLYEYDLYIYDIIICFQSL